MENCKTLQGVSLNTGIWRATWLARAPAARNPVYADRSLVGAGHSLGTVISCPDSSAPLRICPREFLSRLDRKILYIRGVLLLGGISRIPSVLAPAYSYRLLGESLADS